MIQFAIKPPREPQCFLSTPNHPPATGNAPASSSLVRAIELGEHVHRLLEARRGAGDSVAVSLKGLVHQMKLPLPMSTLWRALAIYRWSCEDPEIAHCRHLRLGHLSVLLGVEPIYRLPLLRAAEYHRWSRRELQARASGLKSELKERWPIAHHG